MFAQNRSVITNRLSRTQSRFITFTPTKPPINRQDFIDAYATRFRETSKGSESPDKSNDDSDMSSSQDPPYKPDPARTQQYLVRREKVTSAADAISKRIAQQGKDKALRSRTPVNKTEHMPTKSNDTLTPHNPKDSSNTQQRPISNGAPFQPDPRFTPIDLSRRLSQNDAREQPSARAGTKNTQQRPVIKDELEEFDREFEELAPNISPARKDSSTITRSTPTVPSRRPPQNESLQQSSARREWRNSHQRQNTENQRGDFDKKFEKLTLNPQPQRKDSNVLSFTPSTQPPRNKENNALTSTNWRTKSNQQNIDPPGVSVQASNVDPLCRTEPLLRKLTTRSVETPITYTPTKRSSYVFSAAYAPREMPRPQPTDDYLNQAVDDPVQASAPQRLLIILDLNGTCVHRPRSASPGTSRPHLQPFLEHLFEYHDVMVWSSAMPKNVIKMCRNIFTPEQLQKLVAMWTREDLRLGRLIATRIKGHKQLTWVWEALNPLKKDKSWLYDQTNTVLIDDTRLKAAAEPWNLLEVPEWDGHDQEDDILERAREYIELLRWTRDVSQYLHKHPPSFSTPATVSRETKNAADSLAEDVAMLDLSNG
ncbi:hypothetical protein MBLNU457_7052t1 [Dothideomycetes sp. NU457]